MENPIIGESVHYIPFEGCDTSLIENGVIKSISDKQNVFVVYHCANDWGHYQDYTAARTNLNQLERGWHH